MALFNFSNFAATLESKENGISFEGQGKKWGDEEEGRYISNWDVSFFSCKTNYFCTPMSSERIDRCHR